MIAQILAYASEVVYDWDAHFFQVGGWANARQHQYVRGADCARAKNYLVAIDGELFAAAFYLDPNSALALEDDAMGCAVGPYG